jgi:hypothetical protein
MEIFSHTKSVIAQLIDIGMSLVALAIVLSILIGGSLPFFGSVVSNLTGLVTALGSNGLVGLIVVGMILWLFSSRMAVVARKSRRGAERKLPASSRRLTQMEKVSDILWTSITVLFQLVLVGLLAGLLLGEAGGPVVGSVLVNTKSLLAALNPAAAAVVFVLYLIYRQYRGKEA